MVTSALFFYNAGLRSQEITNTPRYIPGLSELPSENGRCRRGVGVHLQDGLRGGLVDPELFIQNEDLAPR